MVRAVILATLLIGGARCATAGGQLFIDRLDPADGGVQPPPDRLVIDVYVDVSPDDVWTVAGVRGVALGGASLVYATDPASGTVRLIDPGADERFVTFVSRPRPRDATSRFTNGLVSPAGSYSPPSPHAVATPHELNLVFFANPLPHPLSASVDGYIARIALDVFGLCAARDALVFRVDEAPRGFVPIFLCQNVDRADPGLAAMTYTNPDVVGFDWGVYMLDKPVTCAEDFDCDRSVGISDLMLMLAGFGTCEGQTRYERWLDIDNDGCVNLADLSRLLSRFGTQCNP